MLCCVQCPLCQKKIKYVATNAEPLGDHMLKCHPTIQTARFCSISQQPVTRQLKSWKPGFSDMYCPRCCQKVLPLLRKQHPKITETGCGSLLVLGCWPLCFFPFILDFFDENIINLYCPRCCMYLGTYSRKKGLVLAGMRRKLPPIKQCWINSRDNICYEDLECSSKLSQVSECPSECINESSIAYTSKSSSSN